MDPSNERGVSLQAAKAVPQLTVVSVPDRRRIGRIRLDALRRVERGKVIASFAPRGVEGIRPGVDRVDGHEIIIATRNSPTQGCLTVFALVSGGRDRPL
jgi:hypothetical protein